MFLSQLPDSWETTLRFAEDLLGSALGNLKEMGKKDRLEADIYMKWITDLNVRTKSIKLLVKAQE